MSDDLWNYREEGDDEEGGDEEEGDVASELADDGDGAGQPKTSVGDPPSAVSAKASKGADEVGKGTGKGKGGRATNKRGGSVAGESRWSYQNWVRLVHAVTEDTDAFRCISVRLERHELDTGKNPWDVVAEIFNRKEYKPEAHRVARSHPQCRHANPAELPGRLYTAGDLYARWTKFKGNLTTWTKNYEASGNHDSDKYNFATVGSGMCYLRLRVLL